LDEEEVIVWQDVLDEIAAGRPDNLTCPFCHHTPLRIEGEGMRTRIACSQCSKYIEGTFSGY
jgi:transcription elongation factor Elf1